MAPGGRAPGLPRGRLSGSMKVARLHGRQVGGGGGGVLLTHPPPIQKINK